MSILSGMGISAGNATASSIGGAVGGAVSKAFGINSDQSQYDQQKRLQQLQIEGQKELANYSQRLQQEMYDYTYDKTKASAQVKNLKEAGLNTALMYGMSGAGVATGQTGSASAGSVSGASASDSASRDQAKVAQQGMALQMAKLESEIDVNKSVAEANRANAGNQNADKETKDAIRSYTVELEKQEAITKWFDNIKTKYLAEQDPNDPEGVVNRNSTLNISIGIEKSGGFNQQIATDIAQGLANAGNANASALLTNEKAKGYWQELLNATTQAQASAKTAEASATIAENDKVKAAAQKLATEFQTGEFTNWKTWVDTSVQAIGAIGQIAKMSKGGQ